MKVIILLLISCFSISTFAIERSYLLPKIKFDIRGKTLDSTNSDRERNGESSEQNPENTLIQLKIKKLYQAKLAIQAQLQLIAEQLVNTPADRIYTPAVQSYLDIMSDQIVREIVEPLMDDSTREYCAIAVKKSKP